MKWNSDPLLERIEQKLDQLLSKNITTEAVSYTHLTLPTIE